MDTGVFWVAGEGEIDEENGSLNESISG